MPYFWKVWNGEIVLSRFMLTYPGLFDHPAVLCLGCGCGLAGAVYANMTLSKHPLSLLVLTDGEPKTVDLARANLERNNTIARMSRVFCLPLLWGSSLRSFQNSLGFLMHPEMTTAQLSEHTTLFDIVFGCDLLYPSNPLDLLLETASKLLTPTGKLILVSFVLSTIEFASVCYAYRFISIEFTTGKHSFGPHVCLCSPTGLKSELAIGRDLSNPRKFDILHVVCNSHLLHACCV